MTSGVKEKGREKEREREREKEREREREKERERRRKRREDAGVYHVDKKQKTLDSFLHY